MLQASTPEQVQVFKDSGMIRTIKQMAEPVQTTVSEEAKYLAFAFLEKNHGTELEFAGWTRLMPLPGKPNYVRGVVNPWGCEVPVFDLGMLYGKGATEITGTACIVIFEHKRPYKYYFGIVVEEISNVVNIADATENKKSPLLLSARRHLSISPAVKN
jgi:chemotaxis signal transduction protein